jgi:hypothetical protein
MKGQILCVSIVTALFASAANAQTGTRLEAEVPFEFVAGTTKLPAATYHIDRPLPNVIRLSTPDKSVSAMLLVNHSVRNSAEKDGKLVFNRYGDRHFLANVWVPGSGDGVQLRPSAAEREMKAQANQPGSAVIAARRR